MQRTTTRGAVLALLLFVGAASAIAALFMYGSETIGYGPPEYVLAPDAFATVAVTAPAWVVFDAETGKTLAGRATGEPRPIASLTKLMTAETALRALDLSSTTTVSLRAVSTEGRAGGLVWGEEITPRELLFPLLLESSNDAAEALAEAGGDRAAFVAAMNTRAAELGMAGTSFADPSGLSGENRATAHDLQLLVEHLFGGDRYLLNITRLQRYVGEAHRWQNVNPAILVPTYIGGKNGFTDEAGRTLAAVFEEHFDPDTVRPIGIVLLGSDDVLADIAALRDELQRAVRYDRRGW